MKYPFRVFRSKIEEHVFWVAECPALRGCVGQGDSIEEACAELEANEKEWLEAAEKHGIETPPIPIESMNPYSGKFTVRVAPVVHREAAEFAKTQDISLNQYINDAIVAQNSRFSTTKYIAPELKNAVSAFKHLLDAPETIGNGLDYFAVHDALSEKNKYKHAVEDVNGKNQE